MKILVAGATGFIGAAVARKLSQQRHEVLALSRSDAAAREAESRGSNPCRRRLRSSRQPGRARLPGGRHRQHRQHRTSRGHPGQLRQGP
jgi:nucleoside-diphosphate-sugar epimerase